MEQVRDHPYIADAVISKKEIYEIYESIKRQPLVYGTSRGALFSPSAPKLKGVLKKRSGARNLIWFQRYFVLAHMSLFYYASEHESQGEPLGLLTLEHVEVTAESDDPLIRIAARPGHTIAYTKYRNHNAQPVLDLTQMWLRCASEMEREVWLHRMNEYVVSFDWSEGLRFHVD
jgi:hypothetical protein